MCVWGVGCSLDPHRYSVADLGGGTSPKCVFGVLVAVWISQVFSGRSKGGTSPKCVFGVLVAVWILTGIQWQI